MSRILLVDDDDAFRYVTGRLLERTGSEVVTAHDFREALRVLEDGTAVDVLVIDVVLPEVHGFALARMARMKHPKVRCIYLTGHDVALDEAVGPVLHKPIVESDLLREVSAALSSHVAQYD